MDVHFFKCCTVKDYQNFEKLEKTEFSTLLRDSNELVKTCLAGRLKKVYFHNVTLGEFDIWRILLKQYGAEAVFISPPKMFMYITCGSSTIFQSIRIKNLSI